MDHLNGRFQSKIFKFSNSNASCPVDGQPKFTAIKHLEKKLKAAHHNHVIIDIACFA